uniref:protein-serine/threonine phosphatase n=1 Tax=Bursaphelenchus xylophilus TaxID=6326 RepID=A0A1I7S2V1_BURXY
MSTSSSDDGMLYPLNSDEIFECFYALGSYSKSFRKGNLSEFLGPQKLKRLLLHAAALFSAEPTVVDVALKKSKPILVCSEIHGNLTQLLRWFEKNDPPPTTRYIFLGGYIDYGENGVEVMVMLLLYKIAFPEDIMLLRGRHECNDEVAVKGTFYKECLELGDGFFELFHLVFNQMPWLARIIPQSSAVKSVLCGHSGISEWFIPYPNLIFDLKKGENFGLLEKMMFTDIMFSRPKPAGVENDDYFALASKGIGRYYDKEQLQAALGAVECKLFVRGTMAVLKDKNLQAEEAFNKDLYAEVNSGGALRASLVRSLLVSLDDDLESPNFRFIVDYKFRTLLFSWKRKVWTDLRESFEKNLRKKYLESVDGREMMRIWEELHQPFPFPKIIYDHADLAVLIQHFPTCPYRHLDVNAPREGVVLLLFLILYAFYPDSIDTKTNVFTAPFEKNKKKWYSERLLEFAETMRRKLIEDPRFLDRRIEEEESGSEASSQR